MNATAISKIIRRIWVIIINGIIKVLIFGPIFPNKVISKWPAIILAANRTDNVIGRIIFLINSITTINGIKAGGVPWGTKCDIINL